MAGTGRAVRSPRSRCPPLDLGASARPWQRRQSTSTSSSVAERWSPASSGWVPGAFNRSRPPPVSNRAGLIGDAVAVEAKDRDGLFVGGLMHAGEARVEVAAQFASGVELVLLAAAALADVAGSFPWPGRRACASARSSCRSPAAWRAAAGCRRGDAGAAEPLVHEGMSSWTMCNGGRQGCAVAVRRRTR